MLRKKHFCFFIICLLFVLMLSGCKTSEQDSSAPVIPGGTDFTSSSNSSVNTDTSEVNNTQSDISTASSQTGSTNSTVSKPKPIKNEPHLHAHLMTKIEPTCTESGYTLYKCSCGDTKMDNYVPAKGHTFGEWSDVKKPTTITEGEKTRICSVCKKTETQSIAKLVFKNLIDELFAEINAERKNNDKTELKYLIEAQDCANIRAEELVESFGSTRPDGTLCDALFKENNVSFLGISENIAFDKTDAKSVVQQWLDSEIFKANLLSDKATQTVIGVTKSNDKYYWVQFFLTPDLVQ